MNAFKGMFLATALVGGIALAGAKPAAAETLTIEDLIIPGLVVAGGLLLYSEIANNNNRYRWRDGRYDRRYAQRVPRGWVAPPAYRYAPRPLPPGWIIANGRPWPRGVRPGKGHRAKHGRGHDDRFRPGHGFGHYH